MEKLIKDALEGSGIHFGAVVEVDPVENDWLITNVKERESVKVRKPNDSANKTLASSHGGYAGKSIIQRLEDLADHDFRRYMKAKAGTTLISHLDSRVEGICEALGVMKNTSRGVEYEEVLNRYQREITVGEKRPNDG